jgi:hypothetical protein
MTRPGLLQEHHARVDKRKKPIAGLKMVMDGGCTNWGRCRRLQEHGVGCMYLDEVPKFWWKRRACLP